MSDPATLKKKDGKPIAALDDPEKLGLSRTIYAAGNSFKDALIWGTLTTIATIGVLAYGRKRPVVDEAGKIVQDGNLVHKLGEGLEKIHGDIRGGFTRGIEKVGKFFFKGKEIKGDEVFTPATTAAAVVAGSLVGHAVQIPAGISGWSKAQKATDKYDAVITDNKKLGRENQILAEDNARLNEALAKIQRPDPTMEKDAAISRNA